MSSKVRRVARGGDQRTTKDEEMEINGEPVRGSALNLLTLGISVVFRHYVVGMTAGLQPFDLSIDLDAGREIQLDLCCVTT
jgi:hypothetical protein